MMAAEYIRETSAKIAERYIDDCVVHACRTAELLHAERRSPWIGRLREIIEKDGQAFHGFLIPLRYAGKGALAWNVHYVACAGSQAYDPLAGEPVDVERYASEVFGRELVVLAHFDVAETARLLRRGELLRALRAVPAVRKTPQSG